MAEKIKQVDYEEEMGQSYVDYAMSVICDRALPDVRDGLKPVQRRILYSLNELTRSDAPHRKCARIVGDTMGKYHPHGDSSIYEGLVNMAQNWKAENVLVDPHGNFGSVDGSGAAAMRYTEARISKYSEDVCMKDLNFYKDMFVPNFDDTETEPTFLPFQVPNVLVNGSTGIAVGMATNIPTHNLTEVIDATIAYLKNPNISLDELLEIIPGPDFATGGIVNASPETLRDIYETGRGKIKVRGKVEVRDAGHGRRSICVTEIPYTMVGNTQKYLRDVRDLVIKRELPASVVEFADRGDKDGECLCVDVKKGTTDEEINDIINILYKRTGLEDTFGVNMNCIVKGEPKVLGLRKILENYVEYKNELYRIKYEKLLNKQSEILEIKSGLIEAVDIIDLIIEIIRGSKKRADAKDCLMTGNTSQITFKYKGSEMDARQLSFTEKQADAILAMRLDQLIGLEILALKDEVKKAESLVKKYSKLLESPAAMKKQMISDMEEIKEKYGVERRTVIGDFGEVVIKKEEEPAIEVAVLLDRFYYVKVVDASVYDKNLEQIENEYRFAMRCMSSDRLSIFADNENMYTVKISDVIKQQTKKGNTAKKGGGLIGKLSDKGIQIFEFCNMNNDENILYMDCTENMAKKNLLFVGKDGRAKMVEGSVFDVTRKVIAAYKDQMAFISAVDEEDQVVAWTQDGYFVRCNISEIPFKGKGAGGKKLVGLTGKDEVKCACIGKATDNALVSEGKSIEFTRVKLSKMGAKGTKLRL